MKNKIDVNLETVHTGSKASVSKIPINSYIDATHYSSFYYFPRDKTLRVFLGKDLAGVNAIINVEYTKTTD